MKKLILIIPIILLMSFSSVFTIQPLEEEVLVTFPPQLGEVEVVSLPLDLPEMRTEFKWYVQYPDGSIKEWHTGSPSRAFLVTQEGPYKIWCRVSYHRRYHSSAFASFRSNTTYIYGVGESQNWVVNFWNIIRRRL